MYRTPWGWEPCQFMMDSTRGWLRAYVTVEWKGSGGFASLHFLNPKMANISIRVERYDDSLYTNPASHKIVKTNRDDMVKWFNEQMDERREKIAKLKSEVDWMTRSALDIAGTFA